MDEDDFIWSTAAVAVTVITVCSTELSVKKNKRKVWVKRLFQRRQSKGFYEMLLRGLEDPENTLVGRLWVGREKVGGGWGLSRERRVRERWWRWWWRRLGEVWAGEGLVAGNQIATHSGSNNSDRCSLNKG